MAGAQGLVQFVGVDKNRWSVDFLSVCTIPANSNVLWFVSQETQWDVGPYQLKSQLRKDLKLSLLKYLAPGCTDDSSEYGNAVGFLGWSCRFIRN